MEEKTEERGRGCMTTLCYIEKDDSYLMMHRTVKKNDVNKDKWIGVGGHAELGESPEECLLREVQEETGNRLHADELAFPRSCYLCDRGRKQQNGGVHGVYVSLHGRRIHGRTDCM